MDLENHFEVQGSEEAKRLSFPQDNDSQASAQCSPSPHQLHKNADEKSTNADAMSIDRLERGFLQYGCPHYRRRCRIRAPCCKEIFDCRHCHNEAMNSIDVERKLRHDLPRHEVEKVICSLCGTEQDVQQVCINCGVCMGKYFCAACKLFDDDITKRQYHCNGCGICRTGGRENFFHCSKCAYYLHHAYHYAHELAYEDDLTAAFTRMVERLSRSAIDAADAIDQMKSFREAVGSFANPSAIAGRDHIESADWWFNFGYSTPTLRKLAIKILSQTFSSSGCERNWSTFALIHTKVRNRLLYRRLNNLVYVHYNMRLRVKHLTEDVKQRGEMEYDPIDIGFLRDDEDPMVSWVARATTEREEYELDEEADDPEDSPRPNTFLARVVEEAVAAEEGVREDPPASHIQPGTEDEVDLLGEIRMESVGHSFREVAGRQEDDDYDFERLMQGPPTRTQSMREPRQILKTSGTMETRRKGKEKESRKKKIDATESRPTGGVVIREPPPPTKKKNGWFSGLQSKKGMEVDAHLEDPLDIADAELLDPNADDETPSPSGSPRLPSSRSHDFMTTGSQGG